MIPLGPFQLIRPIGRGGSCEVWRGVHSENGLPVAVKVVFGKKARTPRFISSFREEVRAVAGLNHPSIVMVFDYGLIPPETAVHAEGKLQEGSPYLVMELGEETLHAFCDQLSWPSIYKILLALLDGLAHAHARGVIHRDIKPANILVCEGQRQVKLSDFGLAHAIDQQEAPRHAREIVGTPSYMAPEQFELRWRDYGPWTDLYAFGCTTYALLCGFPPFGRTEHLENMMAAHLYQPIPRLPPRLPVPAGFEDWLRRLLQKDPVHRFQRAADAAWALMQIEHGARLPRPRDWSEESTTSPFAPRLSFRRVRGFEDQDNPTLHTLNSLMDTPTPSSLPAVAHDVSAGSKEIQGVLRPESPFGQPEPPPAFESEPESAPTDEGIIPLDPHIEATFTHAPIYQKTFPSSQAWHVEQTLETMLPEQSNPPQTHEPPNIEPFGTNQTFDSVQQVQELEVGSPFSADKEFVASQEPPETTRSLKTDVSKTPPERKDFQWSSPFLDVFATAEDSVLVPPFPDTWRREEWTERARLLNNVGLGLYGLRTVPLVAREQERDQLWSALRQIVSQGEGRLIALKGPTGCGKSRLAQWLCERAHEVGTAHILKAVHSPIAGPADGLGAMLSRYLRYVGLSRREILSRIESSLPTRSPIALEECYALTELLAPAVGRSKEDDPVEQPLIRFSNSTERYEVVRKFLERLSARRTVIAWLDDVHWSFDALSFVSYFMESQSWRPIPVMLLLTVREEAMVERKSELELFETLRTHAKATSIEIGPLTPQENSALVQELLGLRGELALQVEKRTAGNPLFAVQLVGDWVQRGLLQHSARGFRLKPDVQIEIPDSLHQVWTARIGRILEGFSENEAIALELAATLGIEVDQSEWKTVCDISGLTLPEALLEELFEHRLASGLEAGSKESWSFVHSMLRETLERRAREAGRWATHQQACAKMLQQKEGPGMAERLGRHLLLAGDLQGALKPLLKGIWEHVDAGDLRLAELLFVEWKSSLTKLALAPGDLYWGEAWLLRCRIARGVGSYEQGGRLSAMLVKDARKHGWDRILIFALLEQANCGWRMGVEEEEVWLLLQEAEQRALKRQEPNIRAECLRYMGNFLCLRGKLEQAAGYLDSAYRTFEEIADDVGMARCSYGRSNVERQAGRFAEARQYIKLAQGRYESSGIRRGVVDCLNSLGDLARFEGDLETSEACYRDSLERYEALGAGDTSISKLNIALVLLHRERYEEALVLLEQTISLLNQRGQKDLEGIAYLCTLPALAANSDWGIWDTNINQARTLLEETGLCDVDSARVAALSGQLAHEHNQIPRAKDAYLLAIDQWERLGHTHEVETIQAILETLK